jgi:hypothetical protein
MAARQRAQPQLALDEEVVDDELLEQALEKRERAKNYAAAARKKFAEADETAKGHLGRHELGEKPLRVGRFVIVARELEGRAVSFETSPSRRVSIRVAKGEE